MSIATKAGDRGKTGLIGGERVSKADLRVEACGTVDELNSFLGLARSLCTDSTIASRTEHIQRTLFVIGGALATPAERQGHVPVVRADDVAELTAWVEEIEATPGILSDWSIPGAHAQSAAYEVARAVCRRAERTVVRLAESGLQVQGTILAYLNRLSDLLWLFGRLIEVTAGVDARLREPGKPGPSWSRAW